MLSIKDDKERKLALSVTESFIVQAPAGSGKTELLIQRLLTLLTTVRKPEEILAITFTKKSATEMRNRVINALMLAQIETEPLATHAKQTWYIAKKVLERDQQLHWNLIDNPNQLHIQTIDSLCAFLTKQLPLFSHFGSQPTISDDASALYRDAVLEVLSHLEEDTEWTSAIIFLLSHLDNDLNKLHNLLMDMLAKRDQWLPYIHLDMKSACIRDELEHYLQLVIRAHLQKLPQLIPQEIVADLIKIASIAETNLATIKKKYHPCYFENLKLLPGMEISDLAAWRHIANLLLTKSFTFRKKFDKDIGFLPLNQFKNLADKNIQLQQRQLLNSVILVLQHREDLRLALRELSNLPPPQYEDNQWAFLQNLFQLLKVLAAKLRVSFQQKGQIDFIENAQAALFALGNEEQPTDLTLALDYQIRHILVDEFQDTSILQYQLLEKLTFGWQPNDGRTLFVVGDPMQSIYRFRKAEVGLFIRLLKNGIGNIHLKPIELSVNFRSTEKIVCWNNHYFKNIFPQENDIGQGKVIYNPSVTHKSDTKDTQTQILIKGFLHAQQDTQAQEIIKIIRETKKERPLNKIAILVRSRSHLATIIPTLQKAKITYKAIDIAPLASRQCVIDLLSLTCALLHPADRISWLALLRAPWCGLTLHDLTLICSKNPKASIWDELQETEIFEQLTEDGKIRLKRVMAVLKASLIERERHSLRQWVETTWLLLGGPACMKTQSDKEDVETFFSVLEDFSRHHLILNIDILKEKISWLYANPQHEDETLQIMTIHTAKGLEFDTVILPHLERKMPHDDKQLLSWLEHPLTAEQMILLFAPINATAQTINPINDYISLQHRTKSNYETDRLLYVATTRAKKYLYLLFNTIEQEEGKYKIESGSFLEKLWPLFKQEKHIAFMNCDNTSNLNNGEDKKEKNCLIERLQSNWENPISESIPTSFRYHQQQNGFQLVDSMPIIIGIVMHGILQQLALKTSTWWQFKNTDQQKTYIEFQLAQRNLPCHLLTFASQSIFQAIQNTLNDSRGQWILGVQQAAKSEFALTTIIDNKIQKLVIDRTFIDEFGKRWIIDYKTTTCSPSDLEFFLQHEQVKYLEKMHSYAEAFSSIEKRPIALGLYFPMLPAWHEWSYAPDFNSHNDDQ